MSVGWYRDRHGKVRWRYRKGKTCVQLPGKPGDSVFIEAVDKAEKGNVTQTRRPNGMRPHPHRDLLVSEFATKVALKAKHRARAKHIPFSLTAADIEAQLAEQEYCCAISGVPFFPVRQNEPAFRPSLDRIKPTEGYVPGNVRVVVFIANIAMNDWGESYLWRLAEMMLAKRAG